MKNILILFSFLLLFVISFSQPVVNRSSGSNTVNDARIMANLNFITPRYLDTLQANQPANRGVDSCSAIIFTYLDNAHWFRQCNPKKWVLMGERLNYGGGLLKTGLDVVAQFGSAIWNANKFQGINVSAAAPSDTFVMTYNAAAARWEPQPPRGGGGAGGSDGNNFSSVTSFDPATGVFTTERTGLTDLTASIDGRYVKYVDTTTLSLGAQRAIAVGIVGDGTDQTAKINAVMALTSVQELVFDAYSNRDITITGAVVVPAGKTIRFGNGNRIIGTGTWSGGYIVCDIFKQCFSTSVKASNLDNNEVYITWAGAIANNSTDIAPSLRWCRDAIKKINIAGGPNGTTTINAVGTIYVPRGHYRSLDSVWFDKDVIRIIGMGAGRHPAQETRIRFPQDKPAFKFVRYPTGNPGCRAGEISNLYLYSEGLAMDTTAHGVEANCLMTIDNLGTDGFGGNGLKLNTSGIGLPIGDCSNSIVTNHTAYYNRLNGCYVVGEESSNIHFKSCNWKTNGGCGLNDAGFLGNLVEICHAASSGGRPGSLGIVTHNGVTYGSIRGDLYGIGGAIPANYAIEPEVTANWEDYWGVLTGLGFEAYARVWNNTTIYPPVAPYAITGVPTNTTLLHCYSEGGTVGIVMNTYSIAISGDLGTGMARPWMMWFTPQLSKMLSPTIVVRNITTGDSSFVELSSTHGILSGIKNSSGVDVSKVALKYSPTLKQFIAFTEGSQGNISFRINTSETDVTYLGLTTPKTGAFEFGNTLGYNQRAYENSAYGRGTTAGLVAPVAGVNAAGNFKRYIGTDSTIFGWLTTADGTPGTQVLLRTGNGAWNLYNTNGTVLDNRTVSLYPYTLTFRSGSTYASWNNTNIIQFVQRYGSGNMASMNMQSTGGGAVTQLVNYDSIGNSQSIFINATGAGRNISINGGSGPNITMQGDSIKMSAFQGGRVIWNNSNVRLAAGDESNGSGGTYKFVYSAAGIPIFWNLSGTNATDFNSVRIESAGILSLNGSLESNYMKGFGTNRIGVFTPDSSAIFDNQGIVIPRFAKYSDARHDRIVYINREGRLDTTSEDPFLFSYFDIAGDLDDIVVAVNDSTTLFKSIRVVGSTTATVTPNITDSTIQYTISTNGGAVKFDNYADVGNVTTGETDLYSYSTAANFFNANGEKLLAYYAGSTVASATATRTIKVYFAGTEIFASGSAVTSSTGSWSIKVILIRSGTTTVRATVDYSIATSGGGSVLNVTKQIDLSGLTLSGTNILKITGTAGGAGAATNDILAKLATGIFYPVAQ